MIDRGDIDMLAAEYVLGTLEPRERSNVERRRATDDVLDNAILHWEEGLMPLNAHIAPVEPDASVQTRLELKLDDYIAAQKKQQTAGVQESRYKTLADRWRLLALTSSFAAACLALVLVYKPPVDHIAPQEFLAVFQENDQQPAFYMTIDLSTQELSIVPVTAEQKTNKTYQLWIVANEIGPDPQSLGLLDSIEQPIRKSLDEFNAEILKTATFGISLEPEGGSPTGKPTGPAMHGTLYPLDIKTDN